MKVNESHRNIIMGITALLLLFFISSPTLTVQASEVVSRSEESSLFNDNRDEYENPIADGENEGELPPPPDPPENIGDDPSEEEKPVESSDDTSQPPNESSQPESSQAESSRDSSSQSSQGNSSSQASSSESSSKPNSSSSKSEAPSNNHDETPNNSRTNRNNNSNAGTNWAAFSQENKQTPISYRQLAHLLMTIASSQSPSLSHLTKVFLATDFIPLHGSSTLIPLVYLFQYIINNLGG